MLCMFLHINQKGTFDYYHVDYYHFADTNPTEVYTNPTEVNTKMKLWLKSNLL